MAYENVDTTKLRAALNDCLSTLDSNLSSSVIDGLTDDVWSSSAKKNLVNALTTLSNKRYEEIREKINSYLSAVNEIESYQNASDTAEDLKASKKLKEQELAKEKSKTKVDSNKVSSLQKEINTLNTKISAQNSKMNNISIEV